MSRAGPSTIVECMWRPKQNNYYSRGRHVWTTHTSSIERFLATRLLPQTHYERTLKLYLTCHRIVVVDRKNDRSEERKWNGSR